VCCVGSKKTGLRSFGNPPRPSPSSSFHARPTAAACLLDTFKLGGTALTSPFPHFFGDDISFEIDL